MRHLFAATALATAFLAAPAYAEPDYAAAIRADYDKSLAAMWDDFHRNPELSFKEVRTAGKMAAALRAIPGMQVTEKVGQTGVVGVLKNGNGPVVLIRADMDGLPVEEKSGLANASHVRQVGVDGVETPVMHACGHDTHIVGLVATARTLARLKDRWAGTIVFIVQPAEERIGGAKAMLADGLYTRFPKPQYALAYHSQFGRARRYGLRVGRHPIFSSSDSVDITVPGIGAHGASPAYGQGPGLHGVAARHRAARVDQPRAPAARAPASSPSAASTRASSTTSSPTRRSFRSPSAATTKRPAPS